MRMMRSPSRSLWEIQIGAGAVRWTSAAGPLGVTLILLSIMASPAIGAPSVPVLWTAGDLLTGGKLDKVRRCANPECGWLFLDDSRAGKRRWCSMSSCGNRAKARRHYHRSKEE